jgi:hypothetical protein
VCDADAVPVGVCGRPADVLALDEPVVILGQPFEAEQPVLVGVFVREPES